MLADVGSVGFPKQTGNEQPAQGEEVFYLIHGNPHFLFLFLGLNSIKSRYIFIRFSCFCQRRQVVIGLDLILFLLLS